MRLFIAEKPSVAKAIVNELGVVKRNNGYIECSGQNYVTWCFGHLLEQAEPDAYTAEDIPVSKKRERKFGVCRICRFSNSMETSSQV